MEVFVFGVYFTYPVKKDPLGSQRVSIREGEPEESHCLSGSSMSFIHLSLRAICDRNHIGGNKLEIVHGNAKICLSVDLWNPEQINLKKKPAKELTGWVFGGGLKEICIYLVNMIVL